MKRRFIIFGVAVALYAALMHVTWGIGTRQAAEKTEGMLDYAVNDMRITVNGVMDIIVRTMPVVHPR